MANPSRVLFLIGLVPGLVVMERVGAQEVPGRGAPWLRHTIEVGLSGADGGKLHDADGDGDLDLAVGWEESGVTKVYLNPGIRGAVKSPWPDITAGPAPAVEDAVLGDIDGDGRIDVVSSTEGGNRKVLVHFAPTAGHYADSRSWTTAAFPPASGVPDRRWMYALILDVDVDGRADIVAGGKDGGAQIGWFRAPATGRRDLGRWTYHRIGDVGWTMSLIAQDMDGDGDVDIVVSDRKPASAGLVGARWLENPGGGGDRTGPWTNHFIFRPADSSTEVMFMDLADVDGDGDLDAVVPLIQPNRLRWYERLDPTGERWREHAIHLPGGIGTRLKAARMADVDQDGPLDLVLTIAQSAPPLSGALWLEPPGDPAAPDWRAHEISGPAGEKFDDVALTDLDGDGDLDIITTEENAPPSNRGLGVFWYENPRAGEPWFLRGDCNGDGRVVGISDAVFLLVHNFLGRVTPRCRAACDVDGDGRTSGVADPLHLLTFSFLGGPPPAPPFPDCGPGALPADDTLGCELAPQCP